jgi:hypothetical protein
MALFDLADIALATLHSLKECIAGGALRNGDAYCEGR